MAQRTLPFVTSAIKSGVTVAHHDKLFGDASLGRVTNVPASGLVYLGLAELHSSDATLTGNAGGTVKVTIDLERPVHIMWLEAAGTAPADKQFQTVYFDATGKATTANTVDCPAGIVLEINARLGIAVAKDF